MTGDSTLEVYEQRADDWARLRAPASTEEAEGFGALAGRARLGPVADLGCGPGWHSAALGDQVIALDAAAAMLEMVPDHAPRATRVRADLGALPFRPRSLGGAWASRCYVHLPRSAVPMALWDLHRALAVGAPARFVLFEGDVEHEPFERDDFAGRLFSLWPQQLLRDVITGGGFSVAEWNERPTRRGSPELHVLTNRERTLADTVGPDLSVLLCGLNPSPAASEAGVGFARPGNRFWPAALEAGLVTRDRDPVHALRAHGVGMTDLVKRTTRSARELGPDEYRDGAARLGRLVSWLRPSVLCVVGLAGWRSAIDRGAEPGPQPRSWNDTTVYVMPNPSGANAHHRLPDFVEHLREVRRLAR